MLFVASFICQKELLFISSGKVGTKIKTAGFYSCDGTSGASFLLSLQMDLYLAIFSLNKTYIWR